jgi:NAD(P)-dependent dehydrogenase (short-subunit alcohol dehydrogenase family)
MDVAHKLSHDYSAEVTGLTCDVSQPHSVVQAFAAARDHFGTPYVLVNNAGQGASHAFGETTLETWQRMLDVNLTGTFLCTQQVLPEMLAAGTGRIINIASTAGLKGYSHVAAYCAAKHGVVGLTRALAVETAKKGVTVNAICPAYTDTDLATQATETLVATRGISPDEARQMLVRSIPLGRLIEPDEVASAVDWLCSPLATAITGQAIAVAGGEVM